MTHFLNPTVNDDGLKRTLYVSAGVHLALLLFLYFGLPHLMPPLPVPHNPVPFEIVEVSELTNTRVKDQEEAKPKPPEQPAQPAKPPEAAKPAPTPPAPTPPAPTPPQPPKPVAQPQPESLKPAPTPLQKPKPPEPAKPVQQQQDFSKLLKNLEQKKPAATPQEDAKADAKTPPQPAVSSAPTLSTRLTISEEDALRRQMAQCWNMPAGARDAQNLIIQVKLVINPDRTVQSVDVVDKARMATDSFYRAAAEAAVRAFYKPACTPLELPPDKYDQWKNANFTFDPRDML